MNNIRELRKQKNMTQIELASVLKLDQTTISSWERGNSLPTTETLIKLSEIFNVSTDYILGNSKYYYPVNVGKDNLFTFEELQIIEQFRALTPEAQKIIRETLKTFYNNGNRQ